MFFFNWQLTKKRANKDGSVFCFRSFAPLNRRPMRNIIIIVILAIGVSACSSLSEQLPSEESAPATAHHTQGGIFDTLFGPPANLRLQREAQAFAAQQREIDNAKCQEFGFKPGTDAYGNCRLQLEQMRATKEDAVSSPNRREESSKELSLLCKDAISRGNSGGTFVHC